jgi:hypothetical protein
MAPSAHALWVAAFSLCGVIRKSTHGSGRGSGRQWPRRPSAATQDQAAVLLAEVGDVCADRFEYL